MEELTLLGNAAAVPVIIAITQFLKKNFSFKHKSDVVSFAVSVVVCFGWKFYYTPTPEIETVLASGWLTVSKEIIHQLVVAFATWLSASKSYDLFHGTRKRNQKHEEQIRELEKTINGGKDEVVEEDPEIATKLRSILER